MQQFNHIDILYILLWRALAIFLLIGALMGVAVSLLLILKPDLMARANRVANQWISMRRITRCFDRFISLEHWFYQYHRPLGILIMLGAGYILVYFGLLFDKAAALQRLTGYVPNKMLLGGLLDVLVLTSLIGALVALVVGVFLWLRPSLLRGVDGVANQWMTSRRATKVMDVMHDQSDPFVTRHAQRVGWLLLMGSIYLFFVMFRLLV